MPFPASRAGFIPENMKEKLFLLAALFLLCTWCKKSDWRRIEVMLITRLAYVGDNVTFYCKMAADAESDGGCIINLRGENMNLSHKWRDKTSGSRFVLKNVEWKDAGRYFCETDCQTATEKSNSSVVLDVNVKEDEKRGLMIPVIFGSLLVLILPLSFVILMSKRWQVQPSARGEVPEEPEPFYYELREDGI
ncbi:uncharacterized protein LOC108932830 isoform X2 [Scleropages formosus]|uniref:uncharacterized protein LOC108932830 isoform X2 n=1 Tax=Scleropages formosus TaxID=113540 RepID=UPI000878AADE|nr:uncharacterized protein LOC108932830 isoform X2 [Scleropages formosus]